MKIRLDLGALFNRLQEGAVIGMEYFEGDHERANATGNAKIIQPDAEEV